MVHPVTLSTDFGAHYPGAMRGVLAKRGISRVIDVTHELPPHDVTQAAFWLRALLPYQPRAVHCIVVDPGVGGDRDVIVWRTGGHALVGPDNGVAAPVAAALAGGDPIETFRFEHRTPDSATFHGRDVFAPLAAAVATVGIDRLDRLPTLEPSKQVVTLDLPFSQRAGNTIDTVVLATDRFGNAITATPAAQLPDTEEVRVGQQRAPVCRRYGEVAIGEPLVTVGSHGYVELAANQAAGTDAFGVAPGDRVRISWP